MSDELRFGKIGKESATDHNAESAPKPLVYRTRAGYELPLLMNPTIVAGVADDPVFMGVLSELVGTKLTLVPGSIPKCEVVYSPLVPGKSHGVRFDVYLEAEQGRATVELQMCSVRDIEKRIRYYQGALTTSSCLLPGKEYSDMLNSYVIFFCNYDPYNDGAAVHTIRNVVIPRTLEAPKAKTVWARDGAVSVVVSTKVAATKCAGDLGELARMMCGFSSSSDRLRSVDMKVRNMFMNDNVKRVVKDWATDEELQAAEDKGRREGHQEGRQEGRVAGREEGRIEGIIASYVDLYKDGLLPYEVFAKKVLEIGYEPDDVLGHSGGK